LLGHGQGLCLGTGAGLVVAREREEDDEAEQDRKARRQHSEYAGGAVAVLEIASFGRPAANEQHRRDGDRARARGDEESPEEIHGRGSAVVITSEP
jgi:hypothetical protein